MHIWWSSLIHLIKFKCAHCNQSSHVHMTIVISMTKTQWQYNPFHGWASWVYHYQESTTHPQQSLSHTIANCRHLNIPTKCPKPVYIFSFQNNTKCVINFHKFFKATIHFQILCWAPFIKIDSTSSMLAVLMSFLHPMCKLESQF